MAKILFTWEFGLGAGHISPYLTLIKKLEQEGHQVFFAVKCLSKAHQLFKDTNVTYIQAPTGIAPESLHIGQVLNYPQILHNGGYADVKRLTGLIKAWRNLFDLIKPDLLVCDYSPTALLAAKENTFKRLRIGTGFYTPTDITPNLGFATLIGQKQNQGELTKIEDNILKTINQALIVNKLKPLSTINEMHKADACLFRTFPELDHYPDRENGNYVGICESPPGLKPNWPNGSGPKIFIYTKPFPNLPKFFEYLEVKKYPCLIYPDGLPTELIKHFSSKTLKFVDKPLDMKMIGKTADLGICNGNHGTVSELLLSGTPILTLPLHIEQYIVSLNIEKLGAGLSVPDLRADSMSLKLDQIIQQDKFSDAAKSFSNKYDDFNSETLTHSLLDSVHELVNRK